MARKMHRDGWAFAARQFTRTAIGPLVKPIYHRLRIGSAAVGALALVACAAQASDWPARPITAVVPYAAGGNTDTMARIVSERLAATLGQPVVVENVAGASGAIGAIRVARAAPDGNTLLFASASQIIIAPLVQKTGYDPQKDFVPVSIFGAGPYILGVKPSLPVATFREFLAYAKDNPDKLNYASAGPGGIIHLATALLASRAGIHMTHVPYKSGAPALNGLLTGEIDVYFGNASELLQQASSGRVKLLAVSSAARLKQLPDMPTIEESYPGFVVTSWNGFLAPAGTPQPIVRLLARETRNAAKDPAIADRLLQLGIEPSGADPVEFAEVIRAERDFYRAAAAAAGIKMD
jgi:tripartite-type tricarboxylate transporter receptor subunit TctC